jgi:hypothetical protein
VPTSERVCRVDVTVTGNTESSRVCLAGEMGWGLFTDFADRDTRVARGKLVCRVDFGVAADA